MITDNMTGREVVEAAQKSREILGPGVNETIPFTPRIPQGLSKKQIYKDGMIAKELVYIADVMNDGKALLGAFLKSRSRLSDQRYWEYLRLVWVRSGTMDSLPIFRHLFTTKRPFKFWIMTPEEEAELKAMPAEFTVWRAPRPGGDKGISWSITRGFVAEYANANGREVIERKVKKSEVYAYFNRRGEGEIILL